MVKLLSAALLFLSLLALAVAADPPPAYDPLVAAGPEPVTLLLEVADERRGRTLPLRVYLPAATKPAPVILFSHGLGGSRDNKAFLGKHWALRGYVAVFLQHPGSDEDIWKNAPPLQRMRRMKEAASAENHFARIRDVPVVIDALTALTTAFWDARLKDDPAATAWLNGDGAKAALDPKDRWEMNARVREAPSAAALRAVLKW